MWDLSSVNWWAVLISAVLSFVLGGVWYWAFSKPWMALTVGKRWLGRDHAAERHHDRQGSG